MRYYIDDIPDKFSGDSPVAQKTRELATVICQTVQISDERDFSIEKLRESLVWAEAGIKRETNEEE